MDAGRPLITFISRVTEQKTADLVAEAMPQFLERGIQFALIGQGHRELELKFQKLAGRYPGRAAVRIDYEEGAAHRMLAGGDIVLAPSRFEPCGPIQLYGLRYGTIPIVRSTGGLVDTVIDCGGRESDADKGTAFCFDEASREQLTAGIERALDSYRQPVLWRGIQLRAMKEDFGWAKPAAQYQALYYELAPGPERGHAPRDGVAPVIDEIGEQAGRTRRASSLW